MKESKEALVTAVSMGTAYQGKFGITYPYYVSFADGTQGIYNSLKSDINSIYFKEGQFLKFEKENLIDKSGNSYVKIYPFKEQNSNFNKSGYSKTFSEQDIKSIAMSQAFTESFNLAKEVNGMREITSNLRKTIFDWLISNKKGKLAGGVVKNVTLAFTSGNVPLEGLNENSILTKWIEVANYIYKECDPDRFAAPQQQTQQPQQQQQQQVPNVNTAFPNPNAVPGNNNVPF